jgi:predicted RNase H-like HicB family nuclease
MGKLTYRLSGQTTVNEVEYHQVTAMNEAAIRLHVEALKESGFVGTSPDVPGLVAEGRTMTETVEIAQSLARKILESCLEHGDPIPPALASLNGNPTN